MFPQEDFIPLSDGETLYDTSDEEYDNYMTEEDGSESGDSARPVIISSTDESEDDDDDDDPYSTGVNNKNSKDDDDENQLQHLLKQYQIIIARILATLLSDLKKYKP